MKRDYIFTLLACHQLFIFCVHNNSYVIYESRWINPYISGSTSWVTHSLALTWQCQHGLKVSAVCHPRAVLGAGVPQVLILPVGDDHTAGERGHLPVVIGQRRPSDQPTGHTHEEANCLYSRRHGYNKSTKSQEKGARRVVECTQRER